MSKCHAVGLVGMVALGQPVGMAWVAGVVGVAPMVGVAPAVARPICRWVRRAAAAPHQVGAPDEGLERRWHR